MVLLFIDVLGGVRSGTESSSSGELCSDDDEEEHSDEGDGEMKIQDETDKYHGIATYHLPHHHVQLEL